MKKTLILTILFIPNLAYAYIDPGTGAILIQSLIATIALAASAIVVYWNKVLSWFNQLFQPKTSEDENN